MTSVNEMKELQSQLAHLAREVAETQRVLLDLVQSEVNVIREKQDRELVPFEATPKDLDQFQENEVVWTEIEGFKILGHLKDGSVTILGEIPEPPVEEELDLYDEIVRATLEDLV